MKIVKPAGRCIGMGENTRERADYTFVNVGWVRMLLLLLLWLSGCMQMFAGK